MSKRSEFSQPRRKVILREHDVIASVAGIQLEARRLVGPAEGHTVVGGGCVGFAPR